MCGRFTLSKSASEIAAHFDLSEIPALAPRYNVAPGQDIAIVHAAASSEAPPGRALDLARWGFVPAFARGPGDGPRPINARIESVAERKTFRDALRRRRCLVPADGFYEWKTEGGRKLPHHLALADGGLFAIAGLYEDGEEEGRPLRSVVLLTTDARGAAARIHGRMPVILPRAQEAVWLDSGWDGADAAARLAPLDALRVRPVGRRVNDVQHDDPACLELSPLPLFDGS